ncbi:MAG: hypothetical protein IK012_00950 [Fibrobacter sp.]|uniref:hypothetical protein n=1 Tax=Fibrobacter sp. TaxID=35828 RepID=UPI0025B8BABE|nr:hypothetical protein [Fibrobacter sp.]MBR4783811.1 hypothetical protein [Fibrobacter sp.]
MKYTTERALCEIKRRAKIIKLRHDRKITNILTASASFCLIALFAVISIFSNSRVSGVQSEYGAFILPAEAGGYVLVAVLGFVLGVCVTLIIKYSKKKH